MTPVSGIQTRISKVVPKRPTLLYALPPTQLRQPRPPHLLLVDDAFGEAPAPRQGVQGRPRLADLTQHQPLQGEHGWLAALAQLVEALGGGEQFY